MVDAGPRNIYPPSGSLPHRCDSALAGHLVSPKPNATWLAYDRARLIRCEALLRVLGDSLGADLEARFVQELSLPVLHPASSRPEDCLAAVIDWRNKTCHEENQ